MYYRVLDSLPVFELRPEHIRSLGWGNKVLRELTLPENTIVQVLDRSDGYLNCSVTSGPHAGAIVVMSRGFQALMLKKMSALEVLASEAS